MHQFFLVSFFPLFIVLGLLVPSSVVGSSNQLPQYLQSPPSTISIASSGTVLSSGEQIIKGAVFAPDKNELPPFAIRFRSEQKYTDESGFFSFSKKADSEMFEDLPFRLKMQGAASKNAFKSKDACSNALNSLVTPVKNPDKYYLLITKKVVPVMDEKNNVIAFRQAAKKPHLFFSFIAQNCSDEDKPVRIKPRSTQKGNYLIPADRTIIVFLNPYRVKKIEYWPFKLKEHFLQVPRIILKEEREIQEEKNEKYAAMGGSFDKIAQKNNIERQSAKSVLGSFDTSCLYEFPEEAVVYTLVRGAHNKKQPVQIRTP